MQEHEIQTIPASPPQPATLAVAEVMQQVALIQGVLRDVMVPGHHYGVIPGTEARQGEKARPPVLLKPGAEKLCMVFRLAPSFNVRTTQLPNGHREERVTCTLTHIPSGSVIATADGSCSTMESKYRYRNAKPKCPTCGAEAIFKSKSEPGWFCWSKKGGCGETFGPADQRIRSQAVGLTENKDIADQWNTVLKMAVKRALVAATLLATAASDMFIVEEEGDDDGDDEAPPKEAAKGAKEQKRELSAKEAAIAGCLKAVKALNRSRESIAELLLENGISPPKSTWGELPEDVLQHALQVLEGELRLGKPVEAGSTERGKP